MGLYRRLMLFPIVTDCFEAILAREQEKDQGKNNQGRDWEVDYLMKYIKIT